MRDHVQTSPAQISAARGARRAAGLALLGALALGVAGCGGKQGLRGVIGVTLEQPNEFNVLPHAPLRMPNDFAALPAPRPGAPSPLTPQPLEEARAALGAASGQGRAPSTGELALLDGAGADQAQPGIREQLAGETLRPQGQEYAFTEVLGYRIPDGRQDDVLPQRDEADRLRAEGAITPNAPPVEEGDAENELSINF